MESFFSRVLYGPVVKEFEIEVRALEKHLSDIRDFVNDIAEQAGLSFQVSNTLKLVVDEACSNIIRHAYKDMEPGQLGMKIIWRKRALEITLVDQGQGFDWRKVRPPDLNRYVDIGKKGGLGIWFIRKLMDKADYHSGPGGNRLRLVKRFKKINAPGAPELAARIAAFGSTPEESRPNQLQPILLPAEIPAIEDYDIAGFYGSSPDGVVNYFDFMTAGDDGLGIALADVSGKNASGSWVITLIRTALRMESRDNASAADVLVKVNALVAPEVLKKNARVALLYLILDWRRKQISLAGAGHPPILWYHREDNQVDYLKLQGLPLGVDLQDPVLFAQSLSPLQIRLKEGDLLVIYTNGLTKMVSSQSEMLGEEKLAQWVCHSQHLDCRAFAGALAGSLNEIMQNNSRNDNLACIVIKAKTSQVASGHPAVRSKRPRRKKS